MVRDVVTPLVMCTSLLGAYGTPGNIEMGTCFKPAVLQGLGMVGVIGSDKCSSSRGLPPHI